FSASILPFNCSLAALTSAVFPRSLRRELDIALTDSSPPAILWRSSSNEAAVSSLTSAALPASSIVNVAFASSLTLHRFKRPTRSSAPAMPCRRVSRSALASPKSAYRHSAARKSSLVACECRLRIFPFRPPIPHDAAPRAHPSIAEQGHDIARAPPVPGQARGVQPGPPKNRIGPRARTCSTAIS